MIDFNVRTSANLQQGLFETVRAEKKLLLQIMFWASTCKFNPHHAILHANWELMPRDEGRENPTQSILCWPLLSFRPRTRRPEQNPLTQTHLGHFARISRQTGRLTCCFSLSLMLSAENDDFIRIRKQKIGLFASGSIQTPRQAHHMITLNTEVHFVSEVSCFVRLSKRPSRSTNSDANYYSEYRVIQKTHFSGTRWCDKKKNMVNLCIVGIGSTWVFQKCHFSGSKTYIHMTKQISR